MAVTSSSSIALVGSLEQPRALRSVGPTPDLKKLLKAARLGDGRAFAGIYELLGRRVLGFCRSAGVEDPEGVTNEVFLNVFKGLDAFRGSESAFVGWVFQIARNKLIDARRRTAVRPVLVSAASGFDEPMVGSAEDHFLDRSLSPEVASLLARISEGQREVIMLRVVAGLSFKEIGAAIDKRPAAAKEQYRRGLAGLQIAAEGLELWSSVAR